MTPYDPERVRAVATALVAELLEDNRGGFWCRYCEENVDKSGDCNHEPDCPVRTAKELLAMEVER